jgi:hypothetical protein
MYDFFVKKSGFPESSFSRIHSLFSPSPWKTIDRGSTVHWLTKLTKLAKLTKVTEFS